MICQIQELRVKVLLTFSAGVDTKHGRPTVWLRGTPRALPPIGVIKVYPMFLKFLLQSR